MMSVRIAGVAQRAESALPGGLNTREGCVSREVARLEQSMGRLKEACDSVEFVLSSVMPNSALEVEKKQAVPAEPEPGVPLSYRILEIRLHSEALIGRLVSISERVEL